MIFGRRGLRWVFMRVVFVVLGEVDSINCFVDMECVRCVLRFFLWSVGICRKFMMWMCVFCVVG